MDEMEANIDKATRKRQADFDDIPPKKFKGKVVFQGGHVFDQN